MSGPPLGSALWPSWLDAVPASRDSENTACHVTECPEVGKAPLERACAETQVIGTIPPSKEALWGASWGGGGRPTGAKSPWSRKKLLPEDLKESFELEQGDREGAAGNAVGRRQGLAGSRGALGARKPWSLWRRGCLLGSEGCLTCCLVRLAGWWQRELDRAASIRVGDGQGREGSIGISR